MTSASTLKELEEGESATNSNPDFLALVDRLAGNFVEGITTQSIWRHVV